MKSPTIPPYPGAASNTPTDLITLYLIECLTRLDLLTVPIAIVSRTHMVMLYRKVTMFLTFLEEVKCYFYFSSPEVPTCILSPPLVFPAVFASF